MTKGLLFGQDAAVAKAIFSVYRIVPIQYNDAIGIMDNGAFSGGIILHWWNGPNIHLSYFGPRTVTLGIARTICQFVLKKYNVARLTVTVPRPKKELTHWLIKMGAHHEGNMHCFYGFEDTAPHVACQFAIMRPHIERIAWRQLANKTRADHRRSFIHDLKRPAAVPLH